MGNNYKTKDARPSESIFTVRHLPWCKGKYPYDDECWAAAHGRINGRTACENIECRLLRGR